MRLRKVVLQSATAGTSNVIGVAVLNVEELKPRDGEIGPQNRKYIDRVKTILPNFPEEVLGSWFSDHLKIVENFSFLGFENFQFTEEMHKIKDLGYENVFKNGARSIDKICADADITHRRLKRFMDQNNDWPVPPVLLNTAESDLPDDLPQELKRPYHLLEGYHRYSLGSRWSKPLKFWVARIKK